MLLELGDLLLADRLQVVIQGVSPNDLDQVLHRVQDFNVFALRTRTRVTSERQKKMTLTPPLLLQSVLIVGCVVACVANSRNTTYRVRPGSRKYITTATYHCCHSISHAPHADFFYILACMLGYSICAHTGVGISIFRELDMLPSRYRTRKQGTWYG